jgi:ribosome-associated protein
MSPDEDLQAARGVLVPAEAMQWTFARSSGSGGQSVNKTSTKASVTVEISDIVCSATVRARLENAFDESLTITCQTSRSQWRNRVLCIEQLCEKLNDASAPPPAARRKTKPSRGAIERRLTSKRKDSEKKRNRRVIE